GQSVAKTMTEAEWNTCTDPEPMLEHLCSSEPNKALDRKLRHFACACVRRVWDLLKDSRARTAIEVAERYAKGQVKVKDLDKAYSAACDAAEERGAAIDQTDPAEVTLAVLESGAHIDAAAMTAARDIRNGAVVAARLIAGTTFGRGPKVPPETAAELA